MPTSPTVEPDVDPTAPVSQAYSSSTFTNKNSDNKVYENDDEKDDEDENDDEDDEDDEDDKDEDDEEKKYSNIDNNEKLVQSNTLVQQK